MPKFRTVAIDSAGRTVRLVLDAADQKAAVERLRRDGHLPVSAVPDRGAGLGGWLSLELTHKDLRRGEVTDFTRELATMLGAGQDLDRALRFLAETAPNARVRGVVDRLRTRVRDGGALAAAMNEAGRSFSPLYVGLVRAGEAGGNLQPTLERLAVLLERQRSLAATVTSSLIYPAVLLIAAIGSIGFLLTSVLPQFVPLFEQNGASLPWATQVMVDLGAWVSSYGLWALLLLACAGLGLRALLRRPGPGLVADRLLLRLPVAGGLMQEVLAARLTRTLGTLLINGVPLIAALGIVRGVVGNRAGMLAVDRASASAAGGAGLAGPLDAAGVLPARTVHLLRLGEETAQLGPMALRAAELHEEATRLGMQRLVALLVPAITIVMGAAVAGIVSSLMLAMLSLNDLAQ